MSIKYLYIVNHYVPFPQSEYGGLWNVIAQDNDECFDLITSKDQGDYNQQYYSQLRENIDNARGLALAKDPIESRVVEEFTT